ncbi:hypothetical protein TrLO_g13575 [Triparma laevis f. longispina]|uniref:Proteasome alpha-type subunits domain-containing protein n=1 Tax=Triparma laevis f. longispina TaxID=1714387 RepID=A0A9W7EJF2_9STRA|nr:hypothetical protein TrLO_g13575 [Triparma laevis f. longispina]
MGDSAYSFSLTTFSRTGKLLQIEYALNAVSNGRTSLGIAAKDGVVIATDKKVSSTLIDVDAVQKIQSISPSSGFVYSGLGPDYRVLTRSARKNASAYERTYGERQPISQTVKQTASLMQEYTQSGGVRPFGCSVLAAGFDEDLEPKLFQVDPSGAYFGWRATAIGKGFVNAKSFLEKRVTPDILLEDAIHTCLLTLREGFEGEINGKNIEVGILEKETGSFRILKEEEVNDYLNEAN